MNPAAEASTSVTPPESIRGSSSEITTHPLFFLLLLAGAGLAANLALRWEIPLPFCGLREFTGIPCPACGSTRSLLAWTHLDPLAAFRFNPLFFLVCIGVASWAALTVLERITRFNWVTQLQQVSERLPRWRIFLGALIANWLYLYLTLPR